MGQIVGNALAARNYKAQATVARHEGRARQAAYNNKANNLEEESRADSHLAALNMTRQRGNQTAAQSSARASRASIGLTSEGSGMQGELALADIFEKSIGDMALSNALSDNNKRTAATTTRQQGRLAMMQADAQSTQYGRLAKSSQNAAWIQGTSTILSSLLGGLGGDAPASDSSAPSTGGTSGKSAPGTTSTPGTDTGAAATTGTTLPAWATNAFSAGQSAYDLTGSFLQYSPGTVNAGKNSNTNAGNALNDLLLALLGQANNQPSGTPS